MVASEELFKVAGMEVCSGCGGPIQERYMFRVSEAAYYHQKCLSCSACGEPLEGICYTRHSNLFCRHDYNRLYAKKCLGCGDVPSASELVMRATGDVVYHLRCFVCVVCGTRLQRGDHYVLKQGQLFCSHDYEKEVEMMQGYVVHGEYSCDDLVISRCGDGRRGPKRPRTILTTQQRRAFKASFELSPKPCRKIREGLAKDTGLSVRIVQVWFQNQRAKMKKMQKKARDNKTTNTSNNSIGAKEQSCYTSDNNCSDGDNCVSNKGRISVKIKQEDDEHSAQGSSAFLNDSCSDTETPVDRVGGGVGSRGYFTIKEELHVLEDEALAMSHYTRETDPSSLTVTPGGVHHTPFVDFTGDPEKADINGGQIHFNYGHPGQHHLQLMQHHQTTPANTLNPIDRLYSMQNSYFCGDDSII